MTPAYRLLLFTLAIALSGCFTLPPRKQEGAKPLRTGEATARQAGETTEAKNDAQLVRYATSERPENAPAPIPMKVRTPLNSTGDKRPTNTPGAELPATGDQPTAPGGAPAKTTNTKTANTKATDEGAKKEATKEARQ